MIVEVRSERLALFGAAETDKSVTTSLKSPPVAFSAALLRPSLDNFCLL